VKTNLPWALLAVSLCFNAFFVGGYLSARRITRLLATPGGRARLICDRLALDPKQRAEYSRLDSVREARLAEIRKPHAADYDAFWAELLKENPDRARVMGMQEQAAALRGQTSKARVEFLLDLMGILTAEQRAHYMRMARGRSIFAD
jgi:Spy/CpxP family protein refolding chaperone